MNKMEMRKQNWVDFMDLSSSTNRLLVIECAEGMPKRPLLWWENAQERIDWAYERYMRQMENLEWLDDNSIPSVSLITGTEIFAEALGCDVHRALDNNPCAIPLVKSEADVSKIKFPKLSDTKLSILFDMADKLKARAGKEALIGMPDLQTPMDILALVWDKTSLFLEMYENPELVKELSERIKNFLIEFLDEWTKRYGPGFMAHFPDYYIPSGITISEDEVGSVNADMFREFFAPELHELASRYGTIGIHCCANSMHQWENFKNVPNLKLLNLVLPDETLLKSCDYFRKDVAQFIVTDLDISALPNKEEIHLAKYLFAETKKQAKEMVEHFQASDGMKCS